jgi:hypothetical protein
MNAMKTVLIPLLSTTTLLADTATGADAPQVSPTPTTAIRPAPNWTQAYDVNKDGRIDGNERAAIRAAIERARNEFKQKYDTNRDGKLSREEVKAARADIARAKTAPASK